MTNVAATTENSSPPPAPRGVDWIDAATAAKRMNASDRWVTQLCMQRWSSQGLAKYVRPESGGKARWLIREDADPMLGRIKFPQHMPALDTRFMTDAQRQEFYQRQAIYHGWEERCRQGIRNGERIETATAAYLQALKREQAIDLGAVTLYRWRKAYRREGDAGLLDRRWKRENNSIPKDDPFLAEAARLYLGRDYLAENQVSAMTCWEMARNKANQMGWRVWSYRSTVQYLREKTNPAERVMRRFGEKAFEDRIETYWERDYTDLAANELANADHHVFDVWVRVGYETDRITGEVKPIHKRPWLTAFQDCRSRKITGWIIRADDPNTDAILLALREAIRANGIPDYCMVDNGKDFDSYALHGRTKKERRQRKHVNHDMLRIGGAFNDLKIKAYNVEEYHGASKPIERFFGTMEGKFGKRWPTYCGNKPANRPEGLEERVEKGMAPSLEEFVAAFKEWVELGYNQIPHTGDGVDGKTPDRVFAETLVTKRTATDQELDILLMRHNKPVKVGRNGVTWNGVWYGQFTPELDPLLGQKVLLRVDPSDVTRVWVFGLDGRFICIAPANLRMPARAPAALLKAAMATKRHDRKMILGAREANMRWHEDLPDRMSRILREQHAAQAKANEPDPVPPPNMKPLQTSFHDQLNQIQNANEQVMRKAVGDGTPDGPRFLYQSENQQDMEVARFTYRSNVLREDNDE